jgi:hypothetical protein
MLSWAQPSAVRSFAARNPLAVALGISLMIHLALFGGWRLGKQLGWWNHQATWLLNLGKHLRSRVPRADLARLREQQPKKAIPLMFVEVDPSAAVAEAPKDTKYYGAHSSKAANPDPVLDSSVPKVDGRQNKVVKLEDAPKPKPFPLQPTPPPEPANPRDAAESKPKAAEPPGDLAKVKPEELRKPGDAVADIATHERPRTLAAAREQKHVLAGERMKQEGGAPQRGRASLDVVATKFGAYDAAFIAAVQERWFNLLEDTPFTQRTGKVVLEFRLHYDGRITDMKMNGNDVGELLGLLCERAVLDPAPFPIWPDDMRRLMGLTRDVSITFYYD